MIVDEGTPMGRKYPMGVIIIVIKSKRIVEQVRVFLEEWSDAEH